MGILTYQKIREGYIKIEDFDSLSNSLLELDKYIYDRSLELNKLKKKNVTNDCECGNKIKGQDRFCSVCGKKVDDLDDRNMIICEFCDSEIKKKNVTNDCECGNKIKGQDRFCSVCGKKVDDLDDRNMIICEFCDSEIEADSNYCVCCGKKVIFM